MLIPAGYVSVLAQIPSPSSNSLKLGPLTFNYYGLMIALGVLAGVEIGRRRWEARGGDSEDVIELVKWALIAGLIGARMYHVATDWKAYRGRWLDVFKIWEGGLGIPGGLLLGVTVGIWYVKRRGWSVTDMLDAVIPGIPVAQAIGRIGNWFNQEIFGRPTDLPWGLEIEERFRPAEFADSPTFQPTFLYEGLLNLLIAASLIFADKKKWLKPGQILPLWIMMYGVARFFVESLRIDEASLIAGVRINHWMSGIAVAVGLVWFLWIGKRGEAAVTDAADFDSDDSGSNDPGPDDSDVEDSDVEVDASQPIEAK